MIDTAINISTDLLLQHLHAFRVFHILYFSRWT